MKVVKNTVLILILFGQIGLTAFADISDLDGDYQLDFFASSGPCVKQIYVDSRPDAFYTDVIANEWDYHVVGTRIFPRTRENTELGSYTEFPTGFKLVRLTKVVEGGRVVEKLTRSFNVFSLATGRIQADLVYYKEPVFRCIYDKN